MANQQGHRGRLQGTPEIARKGSTDEEGVDREISLLWVPTQKTRQSCREEVQMARRKKQENPQAEEERQLLRQRARLPG